MRFRSTVSVNLKPLMKFASVLAKNLRGTSAGPIRDAVKQWAARYRGFAQERFDTFSKGGGDWVPLKPATIRGRRKGKRGKKRSNSLFTSTGGKYRRKGGKKQKSPVVAAGKVSILRDTNTIFGVLTPTFVGKPGQLEEHVPFGVWVGFGGPGSYAKGGAASIADIALFHQIGAGRLPKRKIIVDPDKPTVDGMENDMARALKRVAQISAGAS